MVCPALFVCGWRRVERPGCSAPRGSNRCLLHGKYVGLVRGTSVVDRDCDLVEPPMTASDDMAKNRSPFLWTLTTLIAVFGAMLLIALLNGFIEEWMMYVGQ